MAVGVARLARSGNRAGRASTKSRSCTGPWEVVRAGVRLRGSELPGQGGRDRSLIPAVMASLVVVVLVLGDEDFDVVLILGLQTE